MPEYLHPGVYVEEIRSGPRPIEGASTSTVGFVGQTQKGRPNHPTFITSWGQFVRKFGEFVSGDQHLPYAVSKFFDNGGKRCFIVRVLNEASAQTAEVPLLARAGGRETLRIRALGGGGWGNSLSVRIEDGTENVAREFKIVVLYEGQEVQIFDNLSLDPNSLTYVESEINDISEFIEVEDRNGHENLNTAQLISVNPLADPVNFPGAQDFTVEVQDGRRETESFLAGNVPRDQVVNRINDRIAALGVTARLNDANNLVLTHNNSGFDQYFLLSGAAVQAAAPLEFAQTFDQGQAP